MLEDSFTNEEFIKNLIKESNTIMSRHIEAFTSSTPDELITVAAAQALSSMMKNGNLYTTIDVMEAVITAVKEQGSNSSSIDMAALLLSCVGLSHAMKRKITEGSKTDFDFDVVKEAKRIVNGEGDKDAG